MAVWLDRDGAVVEPAPGGLEAVAAGIFSGIGVLFVGGPVLALLWIGAERAISAANARRWERESAPGPEWTARR